jgi:hypothetical protein
MLAHHTDPSRVLLSVVLSGLLVAVVVLIAHVGGSTVSHATHAASTLARHLAHLP